MEYKETQESINLTALNEDYMKVYYSRPYQKFINRKIRRLSFSTLIREFTTGYFLKRIKSMMTGGSSYKPRDSVKELRHVDTEERIAVYTVIIGNYDTLKQPYFISSQCDYFVITDHNIKTEGTCWKIKLIDDYRIDNSYSNTKKARYVKTHPEVFFPNYKYSIFLDGNIQIISDLVPLVKQLGKGSFATHLHPSNDCIYQEGKDIIALGKSKPEEVNRQLNTYRQNSFPAHFGLCETNVLVREHNRDDCLAIDSAWWNELNQFTLRDQLSLTYVVWKIEKKFSWIRLLGNNPRKNPRLRYLAHN